MKMFCTIFSIFLLMPLAYSINVTPDSVVAEELSSVPVLTPLVENEQVYKYLSIKNVLPGSSVEFEVNRSWMHENRINLIYLSIYGNGAWNPINTELIDSKDIQNIYRASINSSSYFAIFGKNAPGAVQAIAQPLPQTGLATSADNSKVAALIIAILLIVYHLKK